MNEGTQSRILIVDDDPSMRDSCRQVLVKEPAYSVAVAEDGQSGLKAMEARPADLVFLDLKMPGMNGLDVLDALRRDYPDTVVNVITGYATVESAVDAMKRGAFDFLPKPFTPSELRIVTERALGHLNLQREAKRFQQEKEQLREDVISIVTHQLREPVIVMMQYLQTLRQGYVGELSPLAQEYLLKAEKRAEELLKLSEHWLSFARMDRTKIEAKRMPVPLAPLLAKVTEQIEPLARRKGVALRVSASTSLPKVLADVESLEVVLSNLLSNAVKYNVEGGQVWVAAKVVEGGMEVAVEDSGVGIPEESVPYVFEPFFRVRDPKRQKVHGTGLGLSIARMLVEAQGGTISVKSQLGKGTTFVVRIPLAGGAIDAPGAVSNP